MRSTNRKPITIADLSGDDKAKVARLVEKLVSLGNINEQLQLELEVRGREYRTTVESLQHDCNHITTSKDEEISSLTSKLTMSLGLLRLYQNKLIQFNNELNIRVNSNTKTSEDAKNHNEELNRLDALIENQSFTITNTQQQLVVSEKKCTEYADSLNEINQLNEHQ